MFMGVEVTYLERISSALSRWGNWIAGGTLVAIMLITVGNILSRAVWVPLAGLAEGVGFLAAIVAALALGYTQIRRGHVALDIVVSRFSPQARAVINTIGYFISMVLFGLIAWQVARLAGHYWEIGSMSVSLWNLAFFPFVYVVALGCALLSLVLLVDFLKSLTQAVKK